ncbi:MAG: alpha-glucosidase/alpha-galactosidase [Clostridia bacterium]|nr:alpha-glucosidase/alpha-galactosidase [Clostridia bacterium]MBQ4623652.1 alpha-glucosidase/alpha-galactosidase [Clostridia bacterium]MBQ6991144.1 alpha-glucosidase/alpha-galactosidase [Clostridia bacterium]MBR6762334.1 alpha-glucosidase/alpha-galactosidase [Clostridia bacterium]
MAKITFMGAGSTVFARNVIGDCLCSEVLRDSEFALYDIDAKRLAESHEILEAMNQTLGGYGTIKSYLGVENRKEALRGADFVVDAIQVGLYDPCTIIDFEVPKKYGLRQTIGDTLGIGGIMRALRTIPVLADFARDMEEVCPNAWFLNYTNPMAMLSGYMQRYTGVKTIGLCHSVQVCSEGLLKQLGMEDKLEGRKELIAGINHMGWLLRLEDKNGVDLYPEIKRRVAEKFASGEKWDDMVRFDYIRRFGYYCTESSEHNSEYNPFYIKSKYPELIDAYKIPLDEYPRRCVNQIAGWQKEYEDLKASGSIGHTRSREYASHIMEAMVSGKTYQIGGNVLNNGLIDNLPADACVEVPCLINGSGLYPTHVGKLPVQCAAMNMTNINVQLLTIEAAVTGKKDHIYQAAMLDPHTGSELSIDEIVAMVDDLIEAHGDWLPKYN